MSNVQALALGFLSLAWVSLVAILVIAPDVYDQMLRLPSGDSRPAELAFIVALSAFIVLVAVGVLRRWRWTFWLLLVAVLAGVLRLPACLFRARVLTESWIEKDAFTLGTLFGGSLTLTVIVVR